MSKVRLAIFAGLGACLAFTQAAQADFVLDWSVQTQRTSVLANDGPAFNTLGCQTPAECSVVHQEPFFNDVPDDLEPVDIDGQTPFLYELVTDAEGIQYYHMIVGDPESNFAQEVYIRVGLMGSSSFPEANLLGQLGQGTFADGQLSRATSSSAGQLPNFTSGQAVGSQTGAVNPLDSNRAFTGTGTGNPNRVQMRQIVIDGDMELEFRKENLLDKPSIESTIENGEFRARFLMDSTGNPYTSMNTASEVLNTVEHFDQDIPEASATFFMSTADPANSDVQNSSVTAGRYTYTPGTNQLTGGASGTYQYFDGGANLNQDWSSFFDHREDNPWSYEYLGNRPTP